MRVDEDLYDRLIQRHEPSSSIAMETGTDDYSVMMMMMMMMIGIERGAFDYLRRRKSERGGSVMATAMVMAMKVGYMF